MTISKKVVGVVTLLCVSVGLVGLYGIRMSGEEIRHIGGEVVPAARSLLNLARAQASYAGLQKDLLTPYRVRNEKEEAMERMAAEMAVIDKEVDSYGKRIQDEQAEKQLWQEFKASLEEWNTENLKLIENYRKLSDKGIQDPEKLIGDLNVYLSAIRGWAVQLAASIMTQKPFLGASDAKESGVWEWREKFVFENARLQKLIRQDLAEPLKKLYATGQKRNDILEEDRKRGEATPEAVNVFVTETIPAEKEITKIFDQAIAEAYAARELYAETKAHYLGRCTPSMNKVNQLLERLIQINTDVGAKAANDAVLNAWRYGIMIAAAAVLGLFLAALITRGITRPLSECVDLAMAVSRGDLRKRLLSKSADEAGQLVSALNQMADDLTVQNREVQEGVVVLNSIAGQLSQTSLELAESTSKASSAVGETATTVEQVRQTAATARSVAGNVLERAQVSLEIADSGRRATHDTVLQVNLIREQMELIDNNVVKLSQHGKTLEEVVDTVQDLADQSNLLAVNASLEAARAGDAGRGFSVVATEIKNLADQSRKATERVREILDNTRDLIEEVALSGETCRRAIQSGVELSTRAGESIERIASSVEGSAQAARVIDSSSEQQVAGVDQVALAMNNIEGVVRANLDNASKLTEAARELANLAKQMKGLLERFNLATEDSATTN